MIATFGARPAQSSERSPAKEFRAAWVATVYNLDWPSKPGLSAAAQQAQLRAILDKAVALKLNAILFQVRSASDALYESKRNGKNRVT
ncbi:MAG: family 10 glycosylhydrolase, partial [Chthoniobacteraceae bacterium]